MHISACMGWGGCWNYVIRHAPFTFSCEVPIAVRKRRRKKLTFLGECWDEKVGYLVSGRASAIGRTRLSGSWGRGGPFLLHHHHQARERETEHAYRSHRRINPSPSQPIPSTQSISPGWQAESTSKLAIPSHPIPSATFLLPAWWSASTAFMHGSVNGGPPADPIAPSRP